MNIKGKHLALCRLIQCNYWITEEELLKQGFEQSMIVSLKSKSIILNSNFNKVTGLGNGKVNIRLPVKIQSKIGQPSKKVRQKLAIPEYQLC